MGVNIQMRLHKDFDPIVQQMCTKRDDQLLWECGEKNVVLFYNANLVTTYSLFQLSAKNVMRLNDKVDTFFLQITNKNLDKIPIHLFMNCMFLLTYVAKLTNSILLKLHIFLFNLYFFCVNLTLPFAHNSLLTIRFQTPKCLKMDNKVKIGMFDIG